VDGPVAQRAWVDAFVPDALLARLQAEAEGTDFQVIVHTPGSGWVPVTWEQGKAWTSTGWVEPSRWAWLYQGVGKGAVAELLAAHQVAIIDQSPGRNTLWAWLVDAVAEPLDEDDDSLCPDCDGRSRLVDCLTCWGKAADLEPVPPAGSEVEGARCPDCGDPREHHSVRGCTTDWIWVTGVQVVRGCSCPRTGPCTADAGCDR